MNCTTTYDISTIYGCGVFCKKKTAPLPQFIFDNNSLISKSLFYDSGIITDREYKWVLSSGGYVIYEFGWGKHSLLVPLFNNGSTYSSLNLGQNNIKIKTILAALPQIKVKNTDVLQFELFVKDCDGVVSKQKSNKIKFNIK